jgi:RNA polymerase sigma-70 factor (ECF subfamily)
MMSPDPLLEADDKVLIRQALEASGVAGRDPAGEAAFAVLIGRYQERIFKLLGRFARDGQETEDLAQEVFIKVYRKLHTFQFDSSFYTWLYRIAVNTATDHASKYRRRRMVLSPDLSQLENEPANETARGVGEAPVAPLLREEMERVTRRILDRLPEKYRTVLLLREYEDLAYHEIAATLRVSIGTVESRLFRARQRFKAELTRLFPDLLP